MKRMTALYIITYILFHLASYPVAGASGSVGTVNLGIAASLHPRMSLFEFQLLGFYKVPLGLPGEEFAEAVARSSVSAPTNSLSRRIEELDGELAALTQKKQSLFQSAESTKEGDETFRDQLSRLDEELERIRNDRAEAEFAVSHPELTTPAETRNILDEIEREVMDIVREIAVEKGFSVVLNTTLPVPCGYPLTYRVGKEFGRGVSGLDQQVFYALTANRGDDGSQQTNEERLSRWLQLTGHPDVQPFLPVRPWPLVVHGGESITADVVRRLYARYHISPDIQKALDTAIEEFEAAPPASSSAEKH